MKSEKPKRRRANRYRNVDLNAPFFCIFRWRIGATFCDCSRFFNHLETFKIPNYPCDWKLATKASYDMGMAHWMAEHEVLAAVIFVGLSLVLIAIFAGLEHRYKQQLTARRKDYFS